MVGRTLWASASLRWLKNDISDAELVHEVAANLATLVEAWRSRSPGLPKSPATAKGLQP
jgi:5-dehydro-2-deoxygluconokinase